MEGFTIHYPSQVYTATTYAGLTTYPPSILLGSDAGITSNVAIRNCTFEGGSQPIKLVGTFSNYIRQVEVDACYGYGMNGRFLELAYARDIPRITRCHVSLGTEYLISVHLRVALVVRLTMQ